jgi:hypothetical protein
MNRSRFTILQPIAASDAGLARREKNPADNDNAINLRILLNPVTCCHANLFPQAGSKKVPVVPETENRKGEVALF